MPISGSQNSIGVTDNMRYLLMATLLAASSNMVAAADDYSVKPVQKAPAGLSMEIASIVNPTGIQISNADGPVCQMWTIKSIPTQAKFSATLNVNYPLTPGQLVGVIRVPEGVTFNDFRGQEIKGGVYTLRYGRQPEDGNHIGTSDLYDFLLAIPAKVDTGTKPLDPFSDLPTKSAETAGSTHPAIFSLLPQKDVKKSGVINHDEERDFWIVDLIANGTAADKAVKVPMRIVAVGRSEI